VHSSQRTTRARRFRDTHRGKQDPGPPRVLLRRRRGTEPWSAAPAGGRPIAEVRGGQNRPGHVPQPSWKQLSAFVGSRTIANRETRSPGSRRRGDCVRGEALAVAGIVGAVDRRRSSRRRTGDFATKAVANATRRCRIALPKSDTMGDARVRPTAANRPRLPAITARRLEGQSGAGGCSGDGGAAGDGVGRTASRLSSQVANAARAGERLSWSGSFGLGEPASAPVLGLFS
jgi:hypothetical protein